jgi:hypothetical protein
MNIYSQDDERAIRVQRLLHDWNTSGLISTEQRDRMLPDVQVDLRRTNLFLRGTLFVFAHMIITSAAGLVAITLPLDDRGVAMTVAAVVAAACFAAAQWLIGRYQLYRFGIEEAAAVASGVFFVIAVALAFDGRWLMLAVFGSATVAAIVLFKRFGFVYAGVAAVALATFFVLDLQQTDTFRRLFAAILLLSVFFFARERRQDHDWEFPADSLAVIEAVAWGMLYLITNLKISSWLSAPDEVQAFYWATYGLIWLLPAAGLWFAIRDRHRVMLDVNIVLAIITLSTNKPYLGALQRPWDPIVFGVLLVVVSLGVRRWIAAGAHGSRRGIVAHRLLESEKAALSMAGTATVLAPGAPPATARPTDVPPSFGGGRSGGAGASGSF